MKKGLKFKISLKKEFRHFHFILSFPLTPDIFYSFLFINEDPQTVRGTPV